MSNSSRKIKKKNSRNSANTSLTNIDDIKRTIVSSIIIVIFCIIAVGGIFGIASDIKSVTDDTDDIWEQAFDKVKESMVGVVFNSSNTTEKEYNTLRLRCNRTINDVNRLIDIEKTVNVDVSTNENEFVDKESNTGYIGVISDHDFIDDSGFKELWDTDSGKLPDMEYIMQLVTPKSSVSDYNLVETGDVYFDDMLMIRYINSLGEMTVATSVINSENGSIDTVKQQDMEEYFNSNNGNSVTTDIKNIEKSENEKVITEEEYIKTISNCIETLLKCRTSKDEIDAMNIVTMYMVSNGKDSVLDSRKALNIEDGTDIKFVLGTCGKSNSSNIVKDRVYIQYDIKNNGKTNRVNIIVKLNSSLKIFDIDII